MHRLDSSDFRAAYILFLSFSGADSEPWFWTELSPSALAPGTLAAESSLMLPVPLG